MEGMKIKRGFVRSGYINVWPDFGVGGPWGPGMLGRYYATYATNMYSTTPMWIQTAVTEFNKNDWHFFGFSLRCLAIE